MRTKSLFIAAVMLFLSLPVLAGTPTAIQPPDQVIKQTATQMFAAVNSKHDELKQHPQELYGIIGKILLPHFDFDYASRLVLGPYWRSATPEQRKAFEDAFYKYLVHSYADGLLNGNYSERNLQVEPWHHGGNDNYTTIRTKVLRANAPPVQVDYVMRRTKDGWKAFDVSIEGISYVMNYRNQFGPEIQQKGIDELIKRLNTDADAAPKAKSSDS
ncbi:MAG: MlaC/ttg2D family ABC transporter substrate-binding protein [Gammaproteobacteria bacterium]